MTALLEWLRASLPQAPTDMIGRDEYARHPEMRAAGQAAPIEAAVLIPVIARGTAPPTILFTRRTEHLSRHSGQVSFPGGRREAHDVTGVETALRETMEETGIEPAFVSIAGFLPRYRTGTGFDILPVVGILSDGFALVPDPREVAEIFEAPLDFFLDPANLKQGHRELGGGTRNFHVFEPDGHYIWGITAALLVDLVAHIAPHRAIHDATSAAPERRNARQEIDNEN